MLKHFRRPTYQKGKGLRGRKAYPHHRSLPEGHWDNPAEDRTQKPVDDPAHYQEYRRPDSPDVRDNQNRSILGWVKPGAEFTFDLHVHNLSKVELGALLWLLSLPEDHFLRYGGGKPLGFGSVQLTIDDCNVVTGQGLRERYACWEAATSPSDDLRDEAVEAFRTAVKEAYGNSDFKAIPFIEAFLVACRGFEDDPPIHYPRATDNGQPDKPDPKGENFHWFVENDRGPKHVLPGLRRDQGLPTLKKSNR